MLKYLKCFWTTFLTSLLFTPLYAKRPHSLALKRYGVRIVAVINDPRRGEDLCNGTYRALTLLEQYDSEMFALVKRYVRLVCLLPTNRNARYVPTVGLYFINVLRFPSDFPTEKLPITIAGFLAEQATFAKLKGYMVQFDREKCPSLLEQCRKEHFRIMHKLEQAVSES